MSEDFDTEIWSILVQKLGRDPTDSEFETALNAAEFAIRLKSEPDFDQIAKDAPIAS